MSAPPENSAPPFDTVLIANRGEVALRIVRACRELGIRSVVAYSTADRDSAAVRAADDAVCIGPSAPRRSYMYIPAIIEAARISGAGAIHPGYGFLSEAPDFAEVCEAEGITFIGPSARVMEQVGDKAACKARMAEIGLPLLPGSLHPVEHVDEGRALAGEIGYPVVIKASAGGGGRGMAVVHAPEDFARVYRQTKASAQATFGDARVYIERYLEAARHVEIQVLCDRHGEAIHLGERDCSVQRRQQKLIEESPAPGLPRSVIDEMGDLVVRAARAIGYEGAGTFEFVVDPTGDFYFIEMNCRIQVEHPVTEMVTGIDLVQEQLRIAAGRPLRHRQCDVTLRGVAIECRINAEDPARGFLPTPGRLSDFVPPAGPFVRVDTHGCAGYRIPADYDPLLAKVVVWGPDRPSAIDRMTRALDEFRIAGHGVHSTLGFVRAVLCDVRFRQGEHDTALVTRLLDGDQVRAAAPGRVPSNGA